MRNPFLSLFFLLFLALSLISCSKLSLREKSPGNDPDDTSSKPLSYQHGIFVVNEGNYTWGNASISFIDSLGNSPIQNIFQTENGRNLGDVAQSINIFDSLGYIVVNNSNRIEIVDIKTFKSVKTITGFFMPRYIEFIDSSKAYVTNIQRGISILDLSSGKISGIIPVNGWTENLVCLGSHIYVSLIGEFKEPSSGRKPQIIVIDTQTDKIIDTIPTGKEPIGMVLDKHQKIWVLCSGGYDNFEIPTLMRIDPHLRKTEVVFKFPTGQSKPSRLSINPSGDTLCFLNGGVFRMSTDSPGIPVHPVVNADGRFFYGFAVHPRTGDLFIGDAIDYVQNGVVYQYSPHGQLIKQFVVGRIPGAFCFAPGSNR